MAAQHPAVRHGRSVLLAVVLLVTAAGLPAGAQTPERSATLRAQMDGFSFLDSTRDSVLDTVGWCPAGDSRVVVVSCHEDGPAGSAEVHTGRLRFDANRRVSPAVPGAPRLLLVEVFPERSGTLEVTVDAAPAHGVTFGLAAEAAVPRPADGSAQRVRWTVASDGSTEQVFAVGYTSDLGSSGADDAIPAVTVRLDHGESTTAVEHLRGAVQAPPGTQRVSELKFLPRVVAATGPPRLEAGDLPPSPGPGRTGIRLSGTHELTALGDAPPMTFDDDWVFAHYAESGRFLYGGSFAWIRGGGDDIGRLYSSDSVLAGFEVDQQPVGAGIPPWFRITSGLGFVGDSGRGLRDGEVFHPTYQAAINLHPIFQWLFDPEEPDNDDGRLALDWDGEIFDEAGFVDAYGHLTPGNLPSAYSWLQTMRTVELRVDGGDIDRRNTVTPRPLMGGLEPDVTMRLDSPEGWPIWRVVILGGSPVSSWAGGSFNDDGSYTWGERVDDGKYWLQSQPGPDGLDTWTFDATVITEAWPEDADSVKGVDRVDTHVVAEGDELEVEVFTRDGGHDRLVLGPGVHTVRTDPDGTFHVLD